MKPASADIENVKWFQQKLKDAGYNISVTGINDAQSMAAIKDFQQAKGVQVTGTETLETVHALHDHIVQGMQPVPAPLATAPSGAAANGAMPLTGLPTSGMHVVAAGNPSATEPVAPPVAAPVQPAIGTGLGMLPDTAGTAAAGMGNEAPQGLVRPFAPPAFDESNPAGARSASDSIPAHNADVGLTRSLATHVQKMQGDALDPNNVAATSNQPHNPWDNYAALYGPWSKYQ